MEKPILFSTPMVKAILEGRKTMTRRVIRCIGNEWHIDKLLGDWALSEKPYIKDNFLYWELQTDVDDCKVFKTKVPYKLGDILWVRETWRYGNGRGTSTYQYKADWTEEELLEEEPFLKWKPSIHMPRKAARIFLKVTDIKVERLQDITREDTRAEGINNAMPRLTFAKLWNSLNKKRGDGWSANPWVWVIEFERI